MRIIDADRAKEIAEVSLGDIFIQTATKLLIDKVPTLDAVPVVRCKDCIHFAETKGKDSGKPCGYGRCMKAWTNMIISTEDFCSCGERKNDE